MIKLIISFLFIGNILEIFPTENSGAMPEVSRLTYYQFSESFSTEVLFFSIWMYTQHILACIYYILSYYLADYILLCDSGMHIHVLPMLAPFIIIFILIYLHTSIYKCIYTRIYRVCDTSCPFSSKSWIPSHFPPVQRLAALLTEVT